MGIAGLLKCSLLDIKHFFFLNLGTVSLDAKEKDKENVV